MLCSGVVWRLCVRQQREETGHWSTRGRLVAVYGQTVPSPEHSDHGVSTDLRQHSQD